MFKKNNTKKKKNSYRTLAFCMALSISAAAFFGYKSYSVDHKLDIPVIDTLIGSGSGTSSKTTTTAKVSTSSGSSSKSQGNSSSAGNMLMQLGR